MFGVGFYLNAQDPLTVYDNGNVGIGTSGIFNDYKLQVIGNVGISGTLTVTSLTTLKDGLNVSDGLTVSTGELKVSSGLTTLSGGLTVNGVTNAFVPIGIIVMWSGAINAIPAGWELCDGSNGNPDLR
ncbi:MAG TPA: hypothetical protein PK771_06330, partial [Spirochaetota bacterium]|nr:hypothetical protein [Spirochaetota bacterium]